MVFTSSFIVRVAVDVLFVSSLPDIGVTISTQFASVEVGVAITAAHAAATVDVVTIPAANGERATARIRLRDVLRPKYVHS